MYIFLDGARIRLDPASFIGTGGEADIFDAGNGIAVKIFKPPDHSDFDGMPEEQQAARDRIRVHQRKLPELLRMRGKFPERAVLPLSLARKNQNGALIGYAMPLIRDADVLLRYSDRKFREAGVPESRVARVLLDLHSTLAGIHSAGAVVGDMNDLNVLVSGEAAYVVDADSFQFGPYFNRMFTVRFTDPLKLDALSDGLTLVRPYDENSDWYAYAIMLMQSLLFVGPYGGVFRPKDPARRMTNDARLMRRFTVFHPEVIYPKPAVHYRMLPDELLQYFHRIFERDERGMFPRSLIESLEWRTCACGVHHARPVCPVCASSGNVKERVLVRGTVRAAEIFKTTGVILFAAYQSGELRYLYHEGGCFKRENGKTVAAGALNPAFRFRILGERTYIGKGGRVAVMAEGAPRADLTVDAFGALPLFDVARGRHFWVKNGRLMQEGELGPEEIGSVLEGQTIFWSGDRFGFGFYRAANLSVAFVFEPHRNGINDSVRLPGFTGALIDSTAVFSDERVWFFAALEARGKTTHRCFVIRRDGTCEASAEGEPGDGGWLSAIRGKCAAGKSLFAATDGGIVRLEVRAGAIAAVRQFPDTEPFVDAETQLFADPKGIYAVQKQRVLLLSFS